MQQRKLPISISAGIWIMCLFGLGCARAPLLANDTPARHKIVYGLTLQPSGFDPHIHASSELGIPLRQVYDTLVYRDPETQAFVPGLAESWTISPDGLIYTFNLRRDVRFHDGTPFNAAAVGANLDRIVSPDTGSLKAVFMLGSYSGHELVDDYTIRLLLSESYSPLLDSLSQVYLGMASPTAFNAVSRDRYQFHQVGTGPFTFVEYVPGDRLVLRRSADYAWAPPFYRAALGTSVDEVEFRFFTESPATRAIALESGDAQIMGELLPSDARVLTNNSAIRLIPVPVVGQPLQFLMNTGRYPTDDLRVRQAILFGTNREAIVDAVFQRYSPVAWGPLSANSPYYDRGLRGAYAYDPTQARALLEQAGLTDTDNNGFVEAAGVEIVINVIVPPWGLIPEVAQLIQDQWRTIGLRAELMPVPSRNILVETVNQGEYNLVAFYSFGVDGSVLNDYFLSSGSLNWARIGNPDLDNWLMEATRQTDFAARQGLYSQIQRLIMNEAFILPIRDYVNLNGASATLDGVAFDAYGWFPLIPNFTELE
ncbi:MAG: ABC transporter substrate-binding protein [Chloroflexota bacterium]|nr:ABC transporter substrate-binding protein [Chloroflexota bacterium]